MARPAKPEYFRNLVLATGGTKFLKMQHYGLSTRQNDDTGKENMTRMAEKQSGQLHSAVTGDAEKPDMVNCPHLCGPRHVI